MFLSTYVSNSTHNIKLVIRLGFVRPLEILETLDFYFSPEKPLKNPEILNLFLENPGKLRLC